MEGMFNDAYYGKLEDIKQIYRLLSFDVDTGDSGQQTMLHWACIGKQYDVVKYLVEELGANVSAKDELGWTPLTTAASCGCDDIVELLLKHKSDINVQNLRGCTPLHYCSSKNRLNAARVLLKHGADVHLTEHSLNETPLHRAAATSHPHVMELLLRYNAKVDTYNKYHETPLILAIQNEHLPSIDLLLSYGADINKYCHVTKKTPLDYASPYVLKGLKDLPSDRPYYDEDDD